MVKALIVIDMVQEYMSHIYNPQEVIRNQMLLVHEFNKRGLPTIIVSGKTQAERNPVMTRLWGDEFAGHPKKKELVPELKCLTFSKRIRKTEYSAFFKAELGDYCKKKKIDELYFCGVYSGVCVYFSAVDAAYLKIQPYLVVDASTTEKRDWHKKNTCDFKKVIGPLVRTKALIKELHGTRLLRNVVPVRVLPRQRVKEAKRPIWGGASAGSRTGTGKNFATTSCGTKSLKRNA